MKIEAQKKTPSKDEVLEKCFKLLKEGKTTEAIRTFKNSFSNYGGSFTIKNAFSTDIINRELLKDKTVKEIVVLQHLNVFFNHSNKKAFGLDENLELNIFQVNNPDIVYIIIQKEELEEVYIDDCVISETAINYTIYQILREHIQYIRSKFPENLDWTYNYYLEDLGWSKITDKPYYFDDNLSLFINTTDKNIKQYVFEARNPDSNLFYKKLKERHLSFSDITIQEFFEIGKRETELERFFIVLENLFYRDKEFIGMFLAFIYNSLFFPQAQQMIFCFGDVNGKGGGSGKSLLLDFLRMVMPDLKTFTSREYEFNFALKNRRLAVSDDSNISTNAALDFFKRGVNSISSYEGKGETVVDDFNYTSYVIFNNNLENLINSIDEKERRFVFIKTNQTLISHIEQCYSNFYSCTDSNSNKVNFFEYLKIGSNVKGYLGLTRSEYEEAFKRNFVHFFSCIPFIKDKFTGYFEMDFDGETLLPNQSIHVKTLPEFDYIPTLLKENSLEDRLLTLGEFENLFYNPDCVLEFIQKENKIVEYLSSDVQQLWNDKIIHYLTFVADGFLHINIVHYLIEYLIKRYGEYKVADEISNKIMPTTVVNKFRKVRDNVVIYRPSYGKTRLVCNVTTELLDNKEKISRIIELSKDKDLFKELFKNLAKKIN